MCVKPAKSISEILDEIRKTKEKWGDPKEIWYRGVDDAKYDLLPGAYRPSILDRGYRDYPPMLHFKSIAHGYLDVEPVDDWDWYFLMQHYGLPTRLLDWTEQSIVSIYFAVAAIVADDELHKHCRRAAPTGTPCVWVMDAEDLNTLSWPRDPCVVCPSEDGPFSGSYLPENLQAEKKKRKNRHPIAIYPRRRNRRLIAQTGTFTVHGWNTAPLNVVMKQRRLACIKIDRAAAISSIRDELGEMGIMEHRVFPELEKLARYVRDFELR